MTRRLTVAAASLAAALASPARAEDQALVRVIAEAASVRTGPGFGYRSVYRANQGEVLTVIGRATQDHWFRVELPDGTYGWVLGDEVFPLDVDTAPRTAARRSSVDGKRDLLAVSADDRERHVRVSAGVLGGDGMFLFRPAVLLAPHVALEATIGETVGNQADVIYAGGGFNAYLFPTSPLTPFVGGAAGGAFGRKKADQFAIQTGNYSMVNVGGGLVASFKKRISVRGDVRTRDFQCQPHPTNPGVLRCACRFSGTHGKPLSSPSRS